MSVDYLPNGTVVQSGLKKGSTKALYIPHPVSAMIRAVYALDADENRSGEGYLLDLHVPSLGLPLKKVPMSNLLSSADSFISVTPVASTKNISPQGELPRDFEAGKLDPRYADGDNVIVSFINGNVRRPIVTGFLDHPQTARDGNNDTKKPVKDDGELVWIRHKGFNFKIEDGLVSFKQSKEFQNELPTDKVFEVELGLEGGTDQVKLSLNAAKGDPQVCLEMASASGSNSMKMAKDGLSVVSTVGLETTTIETKSGETNVTSGSPKVSITNKNAATLLLNGSKFAFGNSSVEVFDKLSELIGKISGLAELLTQAQGNLGYPLSNVPDIIALQAELDALKGEVDGVKTSV